MAVYFSFRVHSSTLKPEPWRPFKGNLTLLCKPEPWGPQTCLTAWLSAVYSPFRGSSFRKWWTSSVPWNFKSLEHLLKRCFPNKPSSPNNMPLMWLLLSGRKLTLVSILKWSSEWGIPNISASTMYKGNSLIFVLQYVGYLGFSNIELFLDFYGSFKKSVTGSNLLVHFPFLASFLICILFLPRTMVLHRRGLLCISL